ncbi:MAG: RdgB/HAM1 family non-canonical purine NTP pyrophosphatase [Candidatus Firestonebacteria bacterium]
MKIVLATGNRDKVREIRKALRIPAVVLLTLDSFPGYPKVREDKPDLKGNACKKALAIARFTGKPALADDTGLEVKALHGRPGVYSSRFAGYGATYEDNCRKLLRLMKKVPLRKRKAVFRTVVALALPEGKVRSVEGRVAGIITTEARGKKGFGYDPVFMPAGCVRTFAEMSLAEKNNISHRGRALKNSKKLVRTLLAKEKAWGLNKKYNMSKKS